MSAETPASTYGTVQTDLPEQDLISGLMIQPYHTNPAIVDSLLPNFLAVKNISIVDGANVIQSLNGAEAQATAYYRGRTPPTPNRTDVASAEVWDTFYMRFGMHQNDTDLMLDCNQLTNPQAKLTYDFVTTTYDGVDYDVAASPTFKWTCVADILRGGAPAAPKGFIRSRKVYDYTQAASTTRYIDIARTEPIVGMMLRGGYVGKTMGDDFDQVRLNINNDEWVPFNVYADELEAYQDEWFTPAPEIQIKAATNTAIPNDYALGDVHGIDMQLIADSNIRQNISGFAGGYVDPYQVTADTGVEYSTAGLSMIHCTGEFPHHTAYLPMSEVVDGGAIALDAPQTSRINLEVTSGAAASASATVEVILETIANYTKW